MFVVPIAHDLIDFAAVEAARLLLSLLDEVAEERGVGRKFHMVDVSVEGLVHSEHQLGHACFLSALCPFVRSEEHTSELQSLMRISYAVFCLKKKIQTHSNEALRDYNT